jgi:hypothetical protein
MQAVIDLKQEFYSKWVSLNGLALLEEHGAENSNGILFYAIFMRLCKKMGSFAPIDEIMANSLIRSLEKQDGLLNRRVNDATREAHDNYIGACSLSQDFAKRCVAYGVKNGWNYNNTDGTWIKETQRQGGEVAFYQMSAGYTPDPFYLIWLCVGLIVAAFQWNSVVICAWLRLETLKERKPNFFISFTSMIFDLIILKRGGVLRFFNEYYNNTIYYRMAVVVYG